MKFFLIIFFLFNAISLYADDTIDEIVVTAELSDNSLYKLPLSASVTVSYTHLTLPTKA